MNISKPYFNPIALIKAFKTKKLFSLAQILTFSMIVSMRVFNQGAVTNMILVMYVFY